MRKSIQLREEENFEQMLVFAKKAGFEEVAISFGSGELIYGEDYEEKVYKMKELLDANNIKCRQTHLPCYHLLVSGEETEEKTENAIKNAIKASSILGAEWGAFHPRSDVTGGFNKIKEFEDNKRKLSEYLETAEKYNVGIAVENMPLYHYTEPQWKFFGGSWEELYMLCEKLNSDKIGICWDFGHAHTSAIDQCKVLKYIGDKIKITHVHDNYRNSDHHQLPMLGDDWCRCINWDKLMPVIGEINYNGPITLEVIYPPLAACEGFIKCGYDILTQLEGLVTNK